MKRYYNLILRFCIYILGLFIMTAGIALSVKSNLGVSPVSSIPYTITCVFGIEMGNATILFHIVLVALQIALLRKRFKPVSMLQIVVGIIFGKFTTMCNAMAAMLPTTNHMGIRFLMIAVSIVLVAIGIFFYMPSNIMPLAGEGAMQAVSEVSHIEFAKVKIGFDITMVILSLVTCLIALHSFGSVGVGTILSAVLVGLTFGIINKAFGESRDRFLKTFIPDEAAVD